MSEGTYLTIATVKHSANEVDVLHQQIGCIQGACKHDFKLLNPIKLEESKVESVYIGESDQLGSWHRTEFILKCVKCSVQKICSVREICPRCLKTMEPKELDDRIKYHGKRKGYYASYVHKCSGCNLTIVFDEYDQ